MGFFGNIKKILFEDDEEEINSMPFYKVLLYSHALSVMDGAETEWANADAATPKIELNEIENLINQI